MWLAVGVVIALHVYRKLRNWEVLGGVTIVVYRLLL